MCDGIHMKCCSGRSYIVIEMLALLTALLFGTGCGQVPSGTGGEKMQSVAETTVMPAPAYTPANTPASTFTPTPAPTQTPTPTATPTAVPTPLILLDAYDMTEEGLTAGIEFMAREAVASTDISQNVQKETLLSLWKWVDENIKNDKDEFTEDELRAAYSGLKNKKGGTATKNAVFGALAGVYGIEHMKVSSAELSYDHTWNLLCLEDGWYHFDYYSPKGGHYICFMQTDEQVKVMTADLYPYYHYYDLKEDLPARAEKKLYNGYMEEWMGDRGEWLSEDEILARLKPLEEKYPSGMYWNRGDVTTIPCDHSITTKTCNRHDSIIDRVYVHGSIGDQCRGFASLLSDTVFGADAGVETFASYDELKVGDIFRKMFSPGTTKPAFHSAMILEKTDDHVVVAEVNYDFRTCRIRWGGTYTREYLESCGTWYIRRIQKDSGSGE